MIWFIIFCITYIVLDALHDAMFTSTGQHDSKIVQALNHNWHMVDAAIKAIVIGSMLVFMRYEVFKVLNWVELGMYFFIFSGLRWLIFDPMYNIYRGLHPNYVGSMSWMDKNIRGWKRTMLKFGVLFIIIIFINYLSIPV